MSKVYMRVTLNILVDTECGSATDIMDILDFSVISDDWEKAEVYDVEVDDYEITDAK